MRHCRTSRIENILLMGIRDKKFPGGSCQKVPVPAISAGVSQWVIKNKMGKNR